MQFLELFLFNFPYKYINNVMFAKICVQSLGYRNTSTFISWQILIELLLCARYCAWVRGPSKNQTDMVLPRKHSPPGTAPTKHIITKKRVISQPVHSAWGHTARGTVPSKKQGMAFWRRHHVTRRWPDYGGGDKRGGQGNRPK